MSPALNPNDPPPAGARRLDVPRFEALWDETRPGACPCCDASRLGPTRPRRASTTSARITGSGTTGSGTTGSGTTRTTTTSTTVRPGRKVLPPLGRVAPGRVATWGLLASQDQVAFLVGGAS